MGEESAQELSLGYTVGWRRTCSETILRIVTTVITIGRGRTCSETVLRIVKSAITTFRNYLQDSDNSNHSWWVKNLLRNYPYDTHSFGEEYVQEVSLGTATCMIKIGWQRANCSDTIPRIASTTITISWQRANCSDTIPRIATTTITIGWWRTCSWAAGSERPPAEQNGTWAKPASLLGLSGLPWGAGCSQSLRG